MDNAGHVWREPARKHLTQVITDEATREALCETSQDRHDLDADWVRQNGELIIGGDWIAESGIINLAQLEITAVPGVIRLQRREDGGFRA